jgi:hypothetical protein
MNPAEQLIATVADGALRGVPAEGGVPATEAPVRGKAFPSHHSR